MKEIKKITSQRFNFTLELWLNRRSWTYGIEWETAFGEIAVWLMYGPVHVRAAKWALPIPPYSGLYSKDG